jgi:hypothetical protein
MPTHAQVKYNGTGNEILKVSGGRYPYLYPEQFY